MQIIYALDHTIFSLSFICRPDVFPVGKISCFEPLDRIEANVKLNRFCSIFDAPTGYCCHVLLKRFAISPICCAYLIILLFPLLYV